MSAAGNGTAIRASCASASTRHSKRRSSSSATRPPSLVPRPSHLTTTTPFMNGCGVQWYVYVPGRSNLCTNAFPGLISSEPCSPPSNVIVCPSGSALFQRTAWPAVTTIVSSGNFMALIVIVAPTDAFTSPATAALALLWNQTPKRDRCSGMVNSNPYSSLFKPVAAGPLRELPSMLLTSTLLACSEKVCGELGIPNTTPTLHAAFSPARVDRSEATSPLTPTYEFRRRTAPPARASRAVSTPYALLMPRTAPRSVTGPDVQSSDASPSRLLAAVLYAGVTEIASGPFGDNACRQRR